jgi:hypothetical protein
MQFSTPSKGDISIDGIKLEIAAETLCGTKLEKLSKTTYQQKFTGWETDLVFHISKHVLKHWTEMFQYHWEYNQGHDNTELSVFFTEDQIDHFDFDPKENTFTMNANF